MIRTLRLSREPTGGEGIEIPKFEFFITTAVPNTCLNYYLFLLYVRGMTRFVKSATNLNDTVC